MKAIAYSLFGYGADRVESCFDFNAYLRGLMINLRFNRLLFPDWQTVLETDWNTYNAFESLFKPLEDKNILIIEKNKNGAKLCEAMLWRMKPIFKRSKAGELNYTHVLCRDLDSPATYREVQAVDVWMSHDKAMHAITDSISHDVPLLGGMIGAVTRHFISKTGIKDFNDLMAMCRIDLSTKGADQVFLNSIIYPLVAEKGTDSITQHYFNGYGRTFLSDWHTCPCHPPQGHAQDCPNNVHVNLPEYLKETNEMCGHIGASGGYMPKVERFIHTHKDKFEDLIRIESEYKNIFYWNT